MLKKSFAWRPARIVKSKQGWYILFYQYSPLTKKVERERERFGLNWIKNETFRQKRADELLKWLNEEMLPKGYPHHNHASKAEQMTIKQGIDYALKTKEANTSGKSIDTYRSRHRSFVEYLSHSNKLDMPLSEFSKFESRQYMHFVDSKKVSNRTWNNYKSQMRSLIGELVKDEILEKNPFSKIANKKKEKKKRKNFEENDRRAIAKYLLEHDEQLFIACVLQYYCGIRPCELRRIDLSVFDFRSGQVSISGELKKMGKDHTATLPTDINKYIRTRYAKYNRSYFVFSSNKVPGANQIGRDTLSKRHKKVIDYLYANDVISKRTGYSFYSWKDSGVTNQLDKLDILKVSKQFQIKDLDVLRQYEHPHKKVEAEIKNWEDDML